MTNKYRSGRFYVTLLGLGIVIMAVNSCFAAAVSVPKAQDGYYTWRIVGKKLVDPEYEGKWKKVDKATVLKKDAPQDITLSGTASYSNSVSGTVKVTYGQLKSSLGFNVTKFFQRSMSITKRNAPAGRYYGWMRGVYKRYRVKQQEYFHIDGSRYKRGKPVYCYVKKFRFRDRKLTRE